MTRGSHTNKFSLEFGLTGVPNLLLPLRVFPLLDFFAPPICGPLGIDGISWWIFFKDKEGVTEVSRGPGPVRPLHLAAENGRADCVRCLLQVPKPSLCPSNGAGRKRRRHFFAGEFFVKRFYFILFLLFLFYFVFNYHFLAMV